MVPPCHSGNRHNGPYRPGSRPRPRAEPPAAAHQPTHRLPQLPMAPALPAAAALFQVKQMSLAKYAAFFGRGEQSTQAGWQTSPLGGGCGQGKEFEHRAPCCLNTRVAAGFCLYRAVSLQSTAKAAGEVQQVLGRRIKCKSAVAESSCKCTRTKIRQIKRGAQNRRCFYSYFFCRENVSLKVSRTALDRQTRAQKFFPSASTRIRSKGSEECEQRGCRRAGALALCWGAAVLDLPAPRASPCTTDEKNIIASRNKTC